MRYILIKRVVQKVCDEDITDVKTIKSILQTLFDKKLFFMFSMEGENYQIFVCPKVRVLELHDDYFTYRSFKNRATVKDKAKYKDLKEIKVETETEKLIEKGDKNNRWYLLDLDDES